MGRTRPRGGGKRQLMVIPVTGGLFPAQPEPDSSCRLQVRNDRLLGRARNGGRSDAATARREVSGVEPCWEDAETFV